MTFDEELRGYLEAVASNRDRVVAIEEYALETYLVRPLGHRVEVTTLGAVLMRLRGRDAVQWILTVEVALSRGPGDDWRVPSEVLTEALEPDGVSWRRASDATFLRLRRLEAFVGVGYEKRSPYGDAEPAAFVVPEAMRPAVEAAVVPGPWKTAIEALLADERAAVIPGLRPRVAEATIEQTRMIAHEVRNALVPVRHHVDAILNSASEAPPRARLDAVRRGVVRVLEFVDQLVVTADLVSEPLTTFDLSDAVREAVDRVHEGERAQLIAVDHRIAILAPRLRLVMAIQNVVQNAVQATAASQSIRISASRSERVVRLAVDDGGPGVPEADRTSIFDDGFTTRSGGSGFGLALVKRIVEETLHGKVWCEASDLGGARFVIEIPVGSTP